MRDALILLALPTATGVASVVWAQITATSRLYMAGLNVLAYAVVLCAVAAMDSGALPTVRPPLGQSAVYVALSVVVSLLWFGGAARAPIAVLALAESSWPLVVLAVSRILDGPTPLSRTTWIGAALVMVGAPLIAIGGSRAD